MNSSPPNPVRINLTTPTFDMGDTSPPASLPKSPKNRHISRRSSTDEEEDVGLSAAAEAVSSSNSPDSGVANTRTASVATVTTASPLTVSPVSKSESPRQPQPSRNLEENFESYGENNDVEYEKWVFFKLSSFIMFPFLLSSHNIVFEVRFSTFYWFAIS